MLSSGAGEDGAPRRVARDRWGRGVHGCGQVGVHVRVRAPQVPPGPSLGCPVLLIVGQVQVGLREDVAELCEFPVGHRHAVPDAWVRQLVRQSIVVRWYH